MRYQNYNNGLNIFWLGLIFFMLFGGLRIFFLLFGLALALIINFLPLIILGSLVYLVVKSFSKNHTIGTKLKTKTPDHKRFVELLVHILMHVVKADQKVDQREIQTIINYFQINMHFSKAQLLWVQDVINHSLKAHYSLNELCNEFSAKFRYEAKLMLLDLLYQVALSDSHFDQEEKKIILKAVDLLSISEHDHEQIRAIYIKTTTSQSYLYDILGVTPKASEEELKKAYREAVKKYHPDKVQHLGEEFRMMAEEKMQKINKAYNSLRKGPKVASTR